jgi:hypothetical protein
MKDIIWLSPSLAAGAIAARLVAFFERRRPIRSRQGVELMAPSRAAGFQTGRDSIAGHSNNRGMIQLVIELVTGRTEHRDVEPEPAEDEGEDR